MTRYPRQALEDLLYFIRQGEPITRQELIDAQDIPEKTAWRRLRLWCDLGLARVVNEGEKPHLYAPTVAIEDL